MINPDLPDDLKAYQVNLLVEYSLAERSQKPDKPIEVGYRANVGVDDPQEEWWKLKDKSDTGALAAIQSDVLPAIRALLPKLAKVEAPKPAPVKEWL